jgi:hypothetical protein
MLIACGTVSAADDAPSEYQVKAAVIFKFTRFVEWPETVFSATNTPLVIGVTGENPFGPELERAVKGKDVNGHPFLVKEIKSITDAKFCQILFISTSEKRRLAEIISAVGTLPVLTIGEMDRFTSAGGIINLVIEDNKVRFEINDAAARRAGLRISSKLLSLAKPAAGK